MVCTWAHLVIQIVPATNVELGLLGGACRKAALIQGEVQELCGVVRGHKALHSVIALSEVATIDVT